MPLTEGLMSMQMNCAMLFKKSRLVKALMPTQMNCVMPFRKSRLIKVLMLMQINCMILFVRSEESQKKFINQMKLIRRKKKTREM